MRIGAIEAGGTKMVCAVYDGPGYNQAESVGGADKVASYLTERIIIPTETPEKTIPAMISFFQEQKVQALGIGCFGPVDLNPYSATYGYIKQTPKKDWVECEMAGRFARELKVPVGFDTDVNAAVLGEVSWGAAKGCDTTIYITIGTGVGVGVYCNGGLLHGLVHPEAGHILLVKHPDDTYQGNCPYHTNCMEGLASGPAIEARWGRRAAELKDCREVWELESYYIAQAVTNYILTYSPQKIILWGGVMHQEQLFPMIREKVVQMLGGYIGHSSVNEDINAYIIAPALGENPGILGAVRLGMMALQK